MLLELILAALLVQAAESPNGEEGDVPLLHGGKITMVCPLGGKKYKGWTTSHYSTFGARPDGKPYGSWVFPLPLPECPDNGLVAYREFDNAALAMLEPLVATAEYQAMIKEDSSYYRAQWLASRLGEGEEGALWMLLRATWQAKDGFNDPDLPFKPSAKKAIQYQEEFVTRVLARPISTRVEDQLLRVRAANALRELGRFNDAESVLSSVLSATEWHAEDKDDLGQEDRKFWNEFRRQLLEAIKRGDTSLQPIDMIEETQAAWLCIDPDRPRSDFDKEFCAEPKMQSLVARAEKMRKEMEASNSN